MSLEHIRQLNASEQIPYIAQQLRQSKFKILGSDFGLTETERFVEFVRIHTAAGRRYAPKHYPGRVTLLRVEAEDGRILSLGPTNGWDSFAGLGLAVHIVPGTHVLTFL